MSDGFLTNDIDQEGSNLKKKLILNFFLVIQTLMNPLDLTIYYNRPDLIDETAKQIIKDFNIVGIKISFSGNPTDAYYELFSQILPHISKLLHDKKLNVLLYRIDINESQLFKLMQDNANNLPEAITGLIIKRELQKVVIRNYYKKSIYDKN